MADRSTKRPVRFVSLDTHPANNSLVITYETNVDTKEPDDASIGIQTRAKREQLAINISALDEFSNATDGSMIVPNLQKLSEEVLKECPLLVDGREHAHALEEVQLNLQYMVRRIQMKAHRPASLKSRPPSSQGISSARNRAPSARAGSAVGVARIKNGSGDIPSDIYSQFCAKYLGVMSGRARQPELELLDAYEQQLDAHLSALELNLAEGAGLMPDGSSDNLESQLEGLYGDHDEKRRAVAVIRRFVSADETKLKIASGNRVLVCAMLRTLRDCQGTHDQYLSKSILFCLTRLTRRSDTPAETSELLTNQSNTLSDLLKVAFDLFNRQARWLRACDDLREITASFYCTNSLLVILGNLVRENKSERHKIRKAMILQHGGSLADSLIGLLEMLAKYLGRDTRVPSNRFERLTVTLRFTLAIARHLALFKEFILLLRVPSRACSLINSTISLLSTLQLSRPGSGMAQQQDHDQVAGVSDPDLLLEIYELELELLKFVTNLIYDVRLKNRLMRKNLLLKCILRNLVVFLAASRKSSSLSPFDRSPVLMVPFKCLYELTCSERVKRELYKSRIIMKCLLEYLLAATTDHLSHLNDRSREIDSRIGYTSSGVLDLDLHEGDQIVLEARNASHFILAIWLNLSAKAEAPIYHLDDTNEELREPLCDYLHLVASQLETFIQLASPSRCDSKVMQTRQPTKAIHLSVYLHSKLLRNLSQFLEFVPAEEFLRALSHASHLMLGQIRAPGSQEFVPLAVESLATLANLLAKRTGKDDKQLVAQVPHKGATDSQLYLETILDQLFGETGLLARGLLPEAECDDLLLVSINLLGALARNREICAEIKPITWAVVSLLSGVLERKQSDTEMLISCLFALRQLANHSGFLQELGQSLELGQQRSLSLVDQLGALLALPDLSVARAANSTLSLLKQFEELSTLNESVTWQRRFAAYNSRWLAAVRANRDDTEDESLVDQVALGTPVSLSRGTGELFSGNDDDDDDFRHLRTINDTESRSGSSSPSLSAAHARPDNLKSGTSNLFGSNRSEGERENNDEVELGQGEAEEDGDDDDDDDDEETISEPDLNVIDANSMIKHLTNRREFRSELMRR